MIGFSLLAIWRKETGFATITVHCAYVSMKQHATCSLTVTSLKQLGTWWQVTLTSQTMARLAQLLILPDSVPDSPVK
jgi:hypothetical protein